MYGDTCMFSQLFEISMSLLIILMLVIFIFLTDHLRNSIPLTNVCLACAKLQMEVSIGYTIHRLWKVCFTSTCSFKMLGKTISRGPFSSKIII
jgi:hypothetical protein